MEHKCSGKVWGGWNYHLCGKKAKVERKDVWYCGIHDPEKPPTKSQIAAGERYERQKLGWERRALEKAACANLTNEQLKNMIGGE